MECIYLYKPICFNFAEHTIKNLTEGKAYLFQVAAENEVGQGTFVEIPEPVTVKSAFGKTYFCVL